MTDASSRAQRPAAPPSRPAATVTPEQRDAITAALGELPDDLLHAVRDARGHEFQRLEFLGDAVLELVVRMHALVADGACACAGDPDSLVTDAALTRAAESTGLGDWLEWTPSRERLADLVEACSGAVQLARGWAALAEFVDRFVHPIAPLTPADVESGLPAGSVTTGSHRAHEVLGASVLEVAAAAGAFEASDADEGALTDERNRRYAATRVVERAVAAGWLDHAPPRRDHGATAAARDEVERRLANRAFEAGLATAVGEAAALLA